MKKPKSTPIFDQSDFPISLVRLSIMRGIGVDTDELTQKPLIAVANSHTEMNPGHMHLAVLAQRVKEGIHAAGGIPFEFNVPAPCDAFTEGNDGMRFVLPQRELIADTIETHTRSMLYDGIVMIAGCDKIIPGMLMAAARLDIPAIFLTGGPGEFQIRHSAAMTDGSINQKDYADIMDKLACATCVTPGACEYMGTANTFQCLAEALGLTLPGSANVPAFHSEKLLFARKTGMRIVQMIHEELTSEKILTMDAIENALMVDLAIGGSTNTALHLPAIARERGLDLPLSRFNDFNRKIPTLCGFAPGGKYGTMDLFRAGGIPAVMKMIESDLNLSALCVSGTTMKDVIDEARVKDAAVIPERNNPFDPEGGTVILFGNLASEGAVVKQSAVDPDMRVIQGPARVFESEKDCLTAIREKKIQPGDVCVIRYEGPRGGPGMPETVAVTIGLMLSGIQGVSMITDGRFSGASSGPCVGHVSPEAAAGGPIAAVQDGDEIVIDIPQRRIDVALDDAEIARRLKAVNPPERALPPGYIRRYVKLVGSAARGAVLDD